MRRIEYPSKNNDLISFQDNYYASIVEYVDEQRINDHLKNFTFKNQTLTFKVLVQLDFQSLLDLHSLIENYRLRCFQNTMKSGKPITINIFDELFDYDTNQSYVSGFFMDQDAIQFNTCYYCGIDYINSFTDVGDYKDGLDFVNNANKKELLVVKNIGDVTAQKIIDTRPHQNLSSISLNPVSENQIRTLIFPNSKNHFTLDHVLPQSAYKYYSLCLYNLVPSCYSCNAKFKKAIPFSVNNELNRVSPTSVTYTLHQDVEFQIFFEGKLKNITNSSEFILQKKIIDNPTHINAYWQMFKLSGRYKFHKELVLDMIKNKVKYSESKIAELSNQTGMPQNEIKKMIFGKELFDTDIQDQPLLKFKRDIAKNIKIKEVV